MGELIRHNYQSATRPSLGAMKLKNQAQGDNRSLWLGL